VVQILDEVADQSAWSTMVSVRVPDPALETRIEMILAQMTLEEKLGQMIQAEVQQLLPQDIKTYKIGSALNGAGVWPGKDRYSSPLVWAGMIQEFWQASAESFETRPFSIPFAWATDAVHGHNNLFKATIFPHNIGLGATRDSELISRIGRVTAVELAASGMDWTFAPTVALPLDSRWGRFYEGYSQDPEIVKAFAASMVQGLEGSESGFPPETSVLSSIKHWIGDGGTRWGVDRGTNYCSEEELRELHASGYASAIAAGAQVVMVSFSAWCNSNNYDFTPEVGSPYNFKMHGSRYLITDVLKKQMGFDGVVLTDWDGHCEVSKCTLKDARYCINAGADILMVEARGDWLAILKQTKDDIQAGLILPERIDDANRRILRVKLRSSLPKKAAPLDREVVRHAHQIVGCAEHRAVAREAVRKSLVLLKNENHLLPLQRTARVLLAGSAANSLSKQLGGWSLSWQSNVLSSEEFPAARTLSMALHENMAPDTVTVYDSAIPLDSALYEAAIVAIGEDAYAEMMGDIRPWRSLHYASLKPSYAEDVELLRSIHSSGIPIICVYFGGRPLYLNEELNLSTSFVVAWLPGIAGEGITDVLLRSREGALQHDFAGVLPCHWPATPHGFRLLYPLEETAHGLHPEYAGDQEVLFPAGYGLQYAKPIAAPTLIISNVLPQPLPAIPTRDLILLDSYLDSRLSPRIAGNGFWVGADVSRSIPTDALLGHVEPIDHLGQNDGLHIFFNGRIASLYFEFPDWDVEDMRGYLHVGANLQFNVRMHAPTTGPVRLAAHNTYPSVGIYDATEIFRQLPVGKWTQVIVPLSKIEAAGSDFSKVNVPFMLHTDAEMRFDIANLRWAVPGNGSDGSVVNSVQEYLQ
jgi:beta-glucosidase